ncbi:MAG: GH32 C-terminal domain-containing protein [Clostridia bacterium]|nr:GH32 C-terminal domain-containing protein [Clostridia bacterium]
MGIKRKLTFCALLILAAACMAAGIFTVKSAANAYTDKIEITSNAGDTFKAEEASFDKDASFVFSATVNFTNGDAAALTFGETENGLWAFNVDRAGNRVKLLYFTKSDGGYSARELLSEYFIGNDKITQAERNMVEPNVRRISAVNLKIAVTVNGGAAYLECYADGIRRFAYKDGSAPADTLDLNGRFGSLKYEGGNLGYNVCNADVAFTDTVIGGHDYSYYSELYRNQFHFSQFAHWNNDPNGLVYYNGYYHLYYQHNPFGNVWGAMYWGHARSTDLMHWENLPVCLYPEQAAANGWGGGDGYMWSGSARIYHRGESAVIDGERWFGNDDSGLIAFYTRDGAKQDQMIMSSNDGGLTWTKRRYIPTQDILGLGAAKTDCRDPKVFTYDDNGKTVYGMLLTGMCEPYNVWFLQSGDLVNWKAAGGFKAKVPLVNTERTNGPECPDIAFIEADNGIKKAVITLAGRGYITGDLSYADNQFIFSVNGKNVAEMELEDVPVKQMDFGPDSYAAQTFYIEDGEYAGKTVSVSWLSGVPGAEASVDSGLLTQLRSRWNCGMTIPVIWGLHFDGNGYVLTQTPITENIVNGKATIASAKNYEVKAGEDILKALSANTAEIVAEIENPEGGAVAFRVRVGENEYTEVGWNKKEGYYVDRTHTASGNLYLPNYAGRYVSATADDTKLSFFILCDNGSLEVFCGNGANPFYAVTFSSPNSSGMSFYCEKDVTFTKLAVNKIASVWNSGADDGYLAVGSDSVELDLSLCKQKDVLVRGAGKVSYEVISGKNAVTFVETSDGISIYAESAGEAVIKASCGELVQYIKVKVHGGEADSDCEFGDVISGDWYRSDEGYLGKIKSGDAFVMSERRGGDFMYSATFDLNSGIAAALVFRADSEMTQYVIANYDHGAGLVKLWSSAGDGVQAERRLNDLENVVLTVFAKDRTIKVYLNDMLVIDYVLCEEAPKEGLFGLNVCAAEVLFKCVSVTDDIDKDYIAGDKAWSHTDGGAFEIVNRSLNNKIVDSGFYTVDGRLVTLSQNYMASLPSAGTYVLEIRGKKSFYCIELKIDSVPLPVWRDLKLTENNNAVFFIGNLSADGVKVNGKIIDASLYKVEGMQLTVYADAFDYGENEVTLSENLCAKVTVSGVAKLEPHFNAGHADVIYAVLFSLVGAVLVAEAVIIALIILKKGKKDGGND